MDIKIKIGSILLYMLATSILAFGLVYCFIPTPLPYHLVLLERTFEAMQAELPKVTILIMGLIRLVGCCLLCIAFFLYGIIPTAYRRSEKWVFLLAFPGFLIVNIFLVYITFLHNIPIKWIMVGFLISFITAMILPGKNFFKKGTR